MKPDTTGLGTEIYLCNSMPWNFAVWQHRWILYTSALPSIKLPSLSFLAHGLAAILTQLSCKTCLVNTSAFLLHFLNSFPHHHICLRGTLWCSWLRHCATSRKVTGSIPDGVDGIFHWHNPSGHTMALGLTQPLIEMSTRNISWGVKAASAKGWQPYHLHVPTVLKFGSLNLLEPSGAVQAFNGIALLFMSYDMIKLECLSDICIPLMVQFYRGYKKMLDILLI
jgi:hypothetical protein